MAKKARAKAKKRPVKRAKTAKRAKAKKTVRRAGKKTVKRAKTAKGAKAKKRPAAKRRTAKRRPAAAKMKKSVTCGEMGSMSGCSTT